MAHGILVQNKVAAMNIDSLNRSVVAAADIDNGMVFTLATRNTSATYGQNEVWDATTPATGAGLTQLWMAYEPEVVVTVSGSNKFKGIDNDPRNFYNITGDVFTAFKPQLGDIISMTADSLGTGTGLASAFAVATNATNKLTWAAAAVAGLSLKYLATDYVSIGTGAIDNQRVVSYVFEVVALA